MRNETDIAFDYLEKIYRPAWRNANPGADKRICPSPTSGEWLEIAQRELEFWSVMADPKSILHQHLSEDLGSECITICPECQQNISDMYCGHYKDAKAIENNRCPICDCPGIYDHNDGEFTEKCEDCPRYGDCQDIVRAEEDFAEERSRELLRYQCRGSGEWPPSGIGEYSRMFMGR